jgi:carbamoyl-phosphate synthase large subunit
MKKKILITGAQGDIAQSICRIILKNYKNKIIINGSDIVGSGPSDYIFNKIIYSPRPNTKQYKLFIKKVAKIYDLIIPTTEDEIKFFSYNDKIANGVPLLINKSHIAKIFLNKISTHNFLHLNKIFHPKFSIPLNLIKKYKDPFFLKKIYGHGSKNYKLINTAYKFKKLKMLKKDQWMAQEFYDNKFDEYTCCVIKLDNFISSIVLKRKLNKGMTYFAEVIQNRKIEKALRKIAEISKLEGSLNVQLKIFNNKISIFEINPRLSSTVMMRHMLGFKDCIWWIDYFLNKKIPIKPKIKNRKILKILEEKFI